ncbi:hypothetical protein WA026_010649 [Henosepilachna vigintioctopunctata]|uniref:Ionotropic receptor n=1 Tax=Henosepilachna vigintioctopunctata TaxID=420089 RepID=A0AAW1UX95_9CUCU
MQRVELNKFNNGIRSKMSPLVILTSSIFCIGDIVNDQITGKNYAVILNYHQAFNVPTVRIEISTTRRLILSYDKPKLAVVNLDAINFQQLLDIRNELGFNAYTTYILVGKHLPHEYVLSKVFNRFTFFNSQNGDVYVKNPEAHFNKVIKFGNCYQEQFKPKEIFNNEIMVYKKMPAVPVCYFKYAPYGICSNCNRKGISLDILLMALNLLNLTANFSGYLFPKFDSKSYMNYVFSNEMCVIHAGDEPMPEFDFTQPYTIDSIHWIVPASKEIPRWKYAIQIFSTEVWIAWIISAFAVSVIWYTITYTMKSGSRSNQPMSGFYMIFRLFLEQSQIFNTVTLSQGFLVVTIVISTSLMNFFYESKFAFLLSGLNYEKSINSFEDIMTKKLFIKIPYDGLKLFENEPKTFKYLHSHFKEYDFSLSKIAIEKDSAISYVHRIFLHELKNILDKHNRPLLKELQPPLRIMPISAILRKGDPLTNLLNKKLTYMSAFGFVDHILSKYKVHNAIRDVTLKRMKLNMHNIQFAILVWITGILISIVSFLRETNCYCFKFMKKQ